MLRHQRLQNIPQIFSIIGQCIDVAANTVMTPDQGFSIEIKTTVNKQRDRRKNNRIQNIKNLLFSLSGISPSKKFSSYMSLLYMKKGLRCAKHRRPVT